MVLGVCRRSLLHWHDAEDACQATFLLLARKAGSVRWQPSVANWLYATARKVAHNARVAAARRAPARGPGRVPPPSCPWTAMTGRELLAVLDEELERLPARYREPLVLCYLEGLTRDEAAARLGVTVTALKSRLARGRQRLHDALTKAGCTLGAGLLTLTVTSPAEASPPRLLEDILSAATGLALRRRGRTGSGGCRERRTQTLRIGTRRAHRRFGLGVGMGRAGALGLRAGAGSGPKAGQA